VTATATESGLAVCRSVTVVHGRGEAAVTALADVDLGIAAGERLGLCGRSGSGKTTLLHVLGGLIVPSSGEVLLGGQPLSSLDAAARGEARAHSVAYVFQGANLLPTFTAYENVAFAAHVSHEQDTGHEADDRLRTASPEALLGLVGLASKLDALPAELSGGEAQRVAIARALAQRPALLLCDEPTGQLDSDTGSRVLDLIEALHARLRFALVIATHDPQVAARCDRIVTLEDGRIAADEELEA
jgi:predicted ABC-type transport system involved in lysophospholipase L1 biosynthesis ATPase subunit